MAGDDPECGVYFEPVLEPGRLVKVGFDKLAENNPTKIIGIVPALKAHTEYKPVIFTRYSGGDTVLKEIRKITSGFVLKTGCAA